LRKKRIVAVINILLMSDVETRLLPALA